MHTKNVYVRINSHGKRWWIFMRTFPPEKSQIDVAMWRTEDWEKCKTEKTEIDRYPQLRQWGAR